MLTFIFGVAGRAGSAAVGAGPAAAAHYHRGAATEAAWKTLVS